MHRPVSHALTPPIPVATILTSPLLDPMAPAQNISIPNLVDFGPGIMEALTYANIAQAPYPPPVESNSEDLAATAWETL